MKRPRLSLRIMQGVGVLVACVLIAVGTLAYLSVDDEIGEVYDSQLVSSATVLWSLSQDRVVHEQVKLRDDALPLAPADMKIQRDYAKWRSFRVWYAGKLIRSSDNAPTPRTQPYPRGFTDITVDGVTWRIYTLYTPDDQCVVEVAEKIDARYTLIRRVMRDLFIPLIAGIPVVMLAIWLGIRWGLRDLHAFAGAVRTRSSSNLSSIEVTSTPQELAPLAASLNGLLAELGRSIEQERRFTDNAAHELRTPLATLGVQADVILNARTKKDRQEAGEELAKGVTRASRLLDQLLTLARIRHAPVANSQFNLYDHVRDAVRDIYPKALDKAITLSLSGNEGAMVESKPPLLGILLNNLLDNAIKYSPHGSAVDIMVASDRITISDQGPGIPDDEREQVFVRFYRAKGVSESGSGLGLSIVRNIAELLSCEIILSGRQNGSGLCVTVVFAA